MSSINVSDFHYNLPQEKIALHPLDRRDDSKLLVYRGGTINHTVFKNITDFLPPNSFIFFNDTKVIPARLNFKKTTGAEIEIFLLDPVSPSPIVSQAMAVTTECIWHCAVGNLKRWNDGLVLTLDLQGGVLNARLVNTEKCLVKFSWNEDKSFAEIVAEVGKTPLPPYLNREALPEDKTRYQTIYSNFEGAVAAPTAGLHFTSSVMESLKSKGIGYDFLTLHVSAGTFQPIKTAKAEDHIMHREQIVVKRDNIKSLLMHDRFFIPVGTTSMRTMESIYWYGVKLMKDPDSAFFIQQEEPYSEPSTITRDHALHQILKKMDRMKVDELIGETAIFIRPGYEFKMCDALITNFHQPGSTLILLVAAFTGNDWRKVYNEALSSGYRFLSYGDSSLLFHAR
jgi:S-adenosylmethionine:tRNA ribosyltransferase-isomerase